MMGVECPWPNCVFDHISPEWKNLREDFVVLPAKTDGCFARLAARFRIPIQ